MTANRKPIAQIKIHHGKIIPTVKIGHWLHAEGFTALLIIAIIAIGRLAGLIGRAVWTLAAWAIPPTCRFILRMAAGIYLWFVAFHTE